MKRYALFAGMTYYPGGGWSDFQGSFDVPEDAERAGQANEDAGKWDWFEVVDLETGEVVA